MKIQVIRKKASSLRELGHEEVEIAGAATLRELLTAVARVEFEKQHGSGGAPGADARERSEKRDAPGAQGAGSRDGELEVQKAAAQVGKRDAPATIPPRMLHAGEEELKAQGQLGKVQFGELYDERPGDWEKALDTLFQDFEDGLYRVYVDGTEYTKLSQPLSLEENAQVVFLRLVMLSGRLW